MKTLFLGRLHQHFKQTFTNLQLFDIILLSPLSTEARSSDISDDPCIALYDHRDVRGKSYK